MKRKRIAYGSKLPVYFSQAELTDIREHKFADPDLVAPAIVGGQAAASEFVA
jgi:hypothetical protein